MRRVVITGIGLLTSICNNVNDSWKNLIACKSGIKKINKFQIDDLPCKIAGFINDDSKEEIFYDLSKNFESKELKRNDKFIIYGLAAAEEAIKDADLVNLSD